MDYSATQAKVAKTLAKFGKSGYVTHRAYTVGTYDPATGTNSNSYTDATVIAVVLPFDNSQTTVNGTLILAKDQRLLVDPTVTISMRDSFIIAGENWIIASMGDINPAGTNLLNDLHIRRA